MNLVVLDYSSTPCCGRCFGDAQLKHRRLNYFNDSVEHNEPDLLILQERATATDNPPHEGDDEGGEEERGDYDLRSDYGLQRGRGWMRVMKMERRHTPRRRKATTGSAAYSSTNRKGIH